MGFDLSDSSSADLEREWTAASLEARFNQVSRGRKVVVNVVERTGMGQYDYKVSYDKNENRFNVLFSRSGGFFEAAFCFIERCITDMAASLDSVHLERYENRIDVRFESLFSIIHQKILTHLSDAELALEAQKTELRELCPEGNLYEAIPSYESRIEALSGLQNYLGGLRDELRSGWISDKGAEMICALGYPVFKKKDT